jgi:DNA-binding transcriptional LysR family regulator
VPLEALADRLVLFPRAQGPSLHDAILALFRRHGLVPSVVHEAPRMPTILTLVAAGLGASLVPAGVRHHLPMPGVAFRPLAAAAGEVPSWPLALAHMPLPVASAPAALLRRWRRGDSGAAPA